MNTNQNGATKGNPYPARLDIDYPEKLERLSTFLRLFYIIPIAIILGLINGSGETIFMNEAGEVIRRTSQAAGGLMGGFAVTLALMLLFRQRYPRWWFDFLREYTRFSTRVGAYALLLTDRYPSTEDEQAVHLELDYPDAAKDLNRWLPLVKWLLAIPYYIVLGFLAIAVFFVVIIAWFVILFTATYPKSLFDFVMGVGRWGLRVSAYAFLMLTDVNPPFSLN